MQGIIENGVNVFTVSDGKIVRYGLGIVDPETRLVQLIEMNGFTVHEDALDVPEDAHGWTDLMTLRVVVRPGLPKVARLVALAREFSYIINPHWGDDECSRGAALLLAQWVLEG